jgi:hypothetical protein
MKTSNNNHVMHSLQSLQYLSLIEAPPKVKQLRRKRILPKIDERKLAIFDLDETLVHTLHTAKINNWE